ncbi:MAG: T9SS type A sorting domain-containing protein [Bacteroidetes bacterium]|nr:T9SS type A sorting domain-containing protein [Bacteroidota bacterium]
MLRLAYIYIILAASIKLNAQQRFERFSIEHTYLNLYIEKAPGKHIEGYAAIRTKISSTSENTISFDLLKLKVDSILTSSNQKLTYNYNDTLLSINLDKTYNKNDTFTLKIYYQGTPITDASNWGGFYYTQPYVFNLGVGFDAYPHSYGRVWFPCFDDFNTKCTFDFDIMVETGYTAVANGKRTSVTNANAKDIFHYKLDQPIPSYLACVAVAPYTFYQSQYKNIPIEIAALPKDTSNVRILFSNLNACMQGFEDAYGPYLFDKIGYSLVPFNGGAMEHATNIALPASSANGTKDQETLWAHELSHHWWGDNITCSTPADMWLNESWASYSEALFMEKVYTKNEYKKYVANNHLYVMQYAHIADQSYRAVTDQTHEYVYGRTVYKKGADMIHSMRNIFGDSAFFAITKDFQKTFKFKSVATQDFINTCYKYISNKAKVDAFFKHWIQTPGFTHFEIVAQNTYPKGNQFETKLIIRQKTQGTVLPYEEVPLEITFHQTISSKKTEAFTLGGYETTVYAITDFIPAYIAIDEEEKLSDAITDDFSIITRKTDTLDLVHGKMKVYVNDNRDSTLIHVSHHWVGPDGIVKANGVYMNPYRYWSVDGLFSSSFKANARIVYNGQKSLTDGYLDDQLINQHSKLIKVYTIDGKLLYTNTFSQATKSAPLTFKYKGILVVELTTNNQVETQKIIIE